MVSLDLKDAYLNAPMHPSHWWYLWFALRNAEGNLVVYQWQILPFGLYSHHRQDVYQTSAGMSHVSLYTHSPSPGSLHPVSHARDLWCHFSLGFICNLTKLAPIPSQVMLMGAMIDTARGVVCPSQPGWRPLCMQPWNYSVSPPGCSMPPSGDRLDGILPFPIVLLCMYHKCEISVKSRDKYIKMNTECHLVV